MRAPALPSSARTQTSVPVGCGAAAGADLAGASVGARRRRPLEGNQARAGRRRRKQQRRDDGDRLVNRSQVAGGGGQCSHGKWHWKERKNNATTATPWSGRAHTAFRTTNEIFITHDSGATVRRRIDTRRAFAGALWCDEATQSQQGHTGKPDGAEHGDRDATERAVRAQVHLRTAHGRIDVAKARVGGVDQKMVMHVGGRH